MLTRELKDAQRELTHAQRELKNAQRGMKDKGVGPSSGHKPSSFILHASFRSHSGNDGYDLGS